MNQEKRLSMSYAAASFASAFLLFLVQPMMAKAVTPTYGGTASVWNSALLVGQVLLLLGSLYAYRMIDRRGRYLPRHANMAVTVGAVALLLLLPAYAIQNPLPEFFTGMIPEIGVPLLMLATVGPAMLLLGSQSPILQRSYAMTTGATNPYPLYAASNAGSLMGLLAYPLVLEPLAGTGAQVVSWEIAAIVVLLINAHLVMRGRPLGQSAYLVEETPASTGIRMEWATPAFLATAIMMSAGQAISSDIMAMPLIWIMPLGTFLVGYMTAFSSAETTDFKRSLKIPQAGLLILAASTANPLVVVNPVIGVFAIVSIGLVTHGLMRDAYQHRPPAGRLGSFYLSLACGGAAAGVLVGIVSPLVFDWRWELPICLIVGAYLLNPTTSTALRGRTFTVIIGRVMAVIAIMAGALSILLQVLDVDTARQTAGILLVCLAIAIQSTASRTRFALWTLWLMLALGLVAQGARSIQGELRRSYYGVMSVEETEFDGRPAMVLTHGSTIHGIQMMDRQEEPTTYYTPEGGLGDAMESISRRSSPRIEVAGLGAGTIACLVPDDARLTFHEIDPEVVTAATQDFSFIRKCLPSTRIMIGDARMLIEQGAGEVDAIILDAFTSDAIPLHLMTEEALDSYVDRLADDGWLILHVSNRYLDVSSPVAAWGGKRGHQTMVLDNDIEKEGRVSRSVWMAIRPDGWKAEEKGWKADPRWRPTEGRVSWTDDRSSIMDIIKSL